MRLPSIHTPVLRADISDSEQCRLSGGWVSSLIMFRTDWHILKGIYQIFRSSSCQLIKFISIVRWDIWSISHCKLPYVSQRCCEINWARVLKGSSSASKRGEKGKGKMHRWTVFLKESFYAFSCFFFLSFSVLYMFLCTLKILKKGQRSSSLPHKTLHLKRLVISPTFNSLTLWHHTTSPCHTFA